MVESFLRNYHILIKDLFGSTKEREEKNFDGRKREEKEGDKREVVTYFIQMKRDQEVEFFLIVLC